MDVIDGTKSTKKPTERRGRKRVEGGLKLRDKQYKCKVCFTWFLTLGELNFHKLSHNPSPPPTCYMCVQRKFSSREQLRDHLREKHAKNKAGIWTCGMCLKEISDVWMYNEHLREHATQFARKGQTQSSILGLPGSFMQETAVKNFITSIMQHRSTKASKGEKAKMLSKEAGKAIKENVEEKAKTKEVDDATEEKTNMQSEDDGKQTAPSQAKALYKGEVAQRNSEMHPNCKDPSRDCHHCGKQFPKPFKLQRHLVVHSLQKIFLCHKCPIFYQDAKELKDHLKNVHEEMEEQDPKHTALYTCELCADVMHVIKKSFICSSCNYTFSKKEQFDRHMEKHLTEGSQIFKFRGVLRPSKPSSCYSKDVEFDFSPSKRRKTVEGSHLDCSSDSNFENISALQFNESADTEVPNPGLTPASNFAAIRSSSERKDNGKSESQLKERKTPSNTEQGDSLDKDKVLLKISERTKRDCDNSLKPGLDPVTHITQKKRKELKEYHNSKVSASATRENVDVEMRNTKKLRVHSCSKSDGAGGYRKADATIDYPVLSSVRDDLATNKIVPKHKTRDLKSQTKKNPFNSCLLKKAENVRKLSRDPKGKKGLTARHFQLPASKQSISCVNSSLNMCRPLSGMRPLESHSYRTAESQNHLLSQLFGQKLTSFKIPLRKDTSESLN
ncbi:zinc finger protein 469 isoform X1 [Arapaima gigas]